MSEQNKNTGTVPGGAMNKPASTDNSGTKPSTETREQEATKTPSHEQGREHRPNVNAQNEAADTRRKEEQAHVPTATSKVPEKPSDSANDGKESPVSSTGQAQAGDAKSTVAEGQGERKADSDSVKPNASSTH